jgi:outer membrane protein assembly factor BamB
VTGAVHRAARVAARACSLAGRAGVALAVVCAGVTVEGCVSGGVNDRVNPEVPLWYARPNGALRVLYRRPLTATPRKIGEEYERGRGEIDPRGGRIFIGSADRGLYALRAGDGSILWRFETLGVVQCEPLYDAALDVVYFGSHDGALYAVKARTGELLWRFMSGAEIARKPVLDGETLVFANAADQLFAVDRRTGASKWRAQRTPAAGMEIAGYSGPSIAFGNVYLGYSDGHVSAYDVHDGTERWTPVDLGAESERGLATESARYLDVDTTPIADVNPAGRVVYVASYVGGIFALDAESGKRVWSNDRATGVTELTMFREPAHAPSAGGPFAGGPTVPERKVLLATSATTGFWGLDPVTGRSLWQQPVPDGAGGDANAAAAARATRGAATTMAGHPPPDGGMTVPVPIAGALLIGTSRYGLFLVSPRNGRVIDGLHVGSGFAQTAAVYGNRAFIMSNAGTLLALAVDPPIPD